MAVCHQLSGLEQHNFTLRVLEVRIPNAALTPGVNLSSFAVFLEAVIKEPRRDNERKEGFLLSHGCDLRGYSPPRW